MIIVSIPFSTIKRRLVLLTGFTVTTFQFHLVRLKVSDYLSGMVRYLFQFHLVRLKDGQVIANLQQYEVSIPFSTIKSFHQWKV